MVDDVIPIKSPVGNCYLVTGETPYLVDTNAPRYRARVLAALENSGLKPEGIRYILLTHHHFDHAGNAALLKRLSGAKLAAGQGDAAVIEGKTKPPPPAPISLGGRLLRVLPSSWLERYQDFEPVEVDLLLGDGEVIEELGLEVLEMRGHTEGGVALVDTGKRRAFVGDMVSFFLNRAGPPFLSFSYDKVEILRSIGRLAELDLEYAFPGHGSVIGPGASEKIRDLAEKLEKKWGRVSP